MSNKPINPQGLYPQTPQGGFKSANTELGNEIKYNVKKYGGESYIRI